MAETSSRLRRNAIWKLSAWQFSLTEVCCRYADPVLVSPGGAPFAMQRVMLNESSPGLGPASGNTTIILRVRTSCLLDVLIFGSSKLPQHCAYPLALHVREVCRSW